MPSKTVYLSNLSYERDRNGIISLLRPFGRIKHVKIIVDPSTNQSRGMAFIEMNSVEQAAEAIRSLNQKQIDGRTLKAKYATPLRPASVSKLRPDPKKLEKDLAFQEVQLMKKARNLERRSRRPF
jgi:RNA recognition motif-containing protein